MENDQATLEQLIGEYEEMSDHMVSKATNATSADAAGGFATAAATWALAAATLRAVIYDPVISVIGEYSE